MRSHQQGSTINLNFFVSAKKIRAEDHSVYNIHEDLSTELMPQSRKKAINSAAQKGFTLLEIIVVITIIAVLAAYIAPKRAGGADDARISKVKNDIQVLESALELYRLDNFTYPNSDQGLQALVSNPGDLKNWKAGGYIKKLRKDPWGFEYHYSLPGREGSEFDLYSFGADNSEGGEGSNADIGNWNLDA